MSDIIRVRPSQLRQAARTLRFATGNVGDAVRRAEQDIRYLSSGGVHSDAGNRFMSIAGRNWENLLIRFSLDLEEAAEAFEQAANIGISSDYPTGRPIDTPGYDGPSDDDDHPGQGNPHDDDDHPGQGNPHDDDHPGQGNPHDDDDHPGQGNPHDDDHPGQGNPHDDDHPGQGQPHDDDGADYNDHPGRVVPPPAATNAGGNQGQGDHDYADSGETSERFIADVNQPLVDQRQQLETRIETSAQDIAELETQRETVQTELDRVEAYIEESEGQRRVSREVRERAEMLQEDIVAIDAQIETIQQDIQHAETKIAELDERLNAVAPPEGADIELIREWQERGSSDQWVKNATYDCVNYIVNRMPIPGEIARDAHMWDQQAEHFAQFGITSGDVPRVGSVIRMEREHPQAHNVYGHVMYVERIDPSGEIWVTDNYNHTPVTLSSLGMTPNDPYMEYMYFPWHTQA